MISSSSKNQYFRSFPRKFPKSKEGRENDEEKNNFRDYFLVIIVGAFFGLSKLHKVVFLKTPAMPAEKSAPAVTSSDNPIIEKVFRMRKEKEMKKTKEDIQIKNLEEKLFKDYNINVWADTRLSSDILISFLSDLLADEKSLKIFKQFTDAEICICISDSYDVRSCVVWVDSRDGVEKVARWLQKGKI